MNKQLLAKWSNVIKVIIVFVILTSASQNVKANNGTKAFNTSDSCANAKVENVEIKLLRSTSEYYIFSVAMNNVSSDFSLSFMNSQSDVVYSTTLSDKQFTKRFAISKNEELEGLKITITNNKCLVSQSYDVNFVTKVTDMLLVAKN